MPFQLQSESQLTKGQSDVLGKLKSYSTYGLSAPKIDLFIPTSKQVSLFDYIKQLFNSIGGAGAFENLLKTFLTKLLNPASNYLETKVIGGIAHSLDVQGITIAKGSTNQDWLNQNVLPGFNLAKDQLLNLLLSFIFGPPELMSKSMKKAGVQNPNPSDLLEMVSCGQMLYSVSNLPDQGVGDLEYNKAQLKNQLSSGGGVVFNISCQQVVIQMPEQVLSSIVYGTNATIGGSSQSASFNPELAINALDSWIQNEVSRQNVPENKSSSSKTFFENFIEQLLNLISAIVQPFISPIFKSINSLGKPFNTTTDANGNKINTPIQVTENMVVASTCDIYNDGLKKMSGKPNNSDILGAFLSFLLNAVLGLLLSILLAELIKEIKKLLQNVVVKKAEDLAQRIINQRLAEFEAFFGAASAEAQKLAKLASALAKLKPLLQIK